ncbi:MAG: hypothetical protein JNL32_00915 [Candidatus Kapabacteria bacterium]|nr:hypothetical protein [Candidatus Kapabacteria bacterium]
MVTLPYNINSQRTSTQEFIRRGLGDASLTALYSAWVSQPQSSNDTVCSVPAITHALLIGGGLKIPTGSYQFNPYSTTEVANANFQLGTGSWDILISGNYTIRGEVYGAMVDVQARIPTVNSNGYRFGNRAMTTFAGFALLSLSSDIRMMPLVGISSEISMQDIRQNKTVAETGGVTGFALLGTDIYFMNTLSIGCTVSIPVASQMADGEIRPAPRVTIQSAWLW